MTDSAPGGGNDTFDPALLARVRAEALEAGLDLYTYLESKEYPPPLMFGLLQAHTGDLRKTLNEAAARTRKAKANGGARERCGHGNWLPWLEREFGWKEQTADNFISVAEAATKSPKFGDLNVPVSGLYLLARPDTPTEVIDEVAERSAAAHAARRAVRLCRLAIAVGGRAGVALLCGPPARA